MFGERPFSEAESHRLLYANSHRAVTVLGRALLGIKVFGQENIPMEGPVVLAGNHRHWLDILVLPSAVPRRHVTMVSRHEVLESPYSGAYFRMVGALPVHRHENRPQEVIQIIRRVKNGHAAALFPEETRDKERVKSRQFADLKEFQPGVARIAKKAGALTVPVALYGMDSGWNPRKPRGIAFDLPMSPPTDDEGGWLEELQTRIEDRYIWLHHKLSKTDKIEQ